MISDYLTFDPLMTHLRNPDPGLWENPTLSVSCSLNYLQFFVVILVISLSFKELSIGVIVVAEI